MYVIVTNHVNWHRENTGNLKMQFEGIFVYICTIHGSVSLFQIFELTDFNKKHKNISFKPLNFAVMLKMSNTQLHEKSFRVSKNDFLLVTIHFYCRIENYDGNFNPLKYIDGYILFLQKNVLMIPALLFQCSRLYCTCNFYHLTF